MERYTRRAVLAAGAAGLAGVAGCAGILPGGSDGSAAYPSFGYGRRSRSHSANASGPSGEVSERWRFEDAAGIAPPAVVEGGASDAGTVYCLRRGTPASLVALSADSGDVEWEYDLGTDVRPSTPAVADTAEGRTVYVGDADGGVHAVAAGSGERRWRTTLEKSATGTNPVVADGTVVIGSGSLQLFEFGGVYALDAADGSVRWRADESRAAPRTLAVADGTVYYGAADEEGHVVAVSLSDGSTAWSTPIETVAPGVCVSNGRVYPGTIGEGPLALDAGDGSELWRDSRDEVGFTPAVGDGSLYTVFPPSAADERGSVELAAMDAADGTTEWTVDVELDAAMGYPVPPTVADGVVYRGIEAAGLAAHDAGSGDEQWSFAPEDATPLGRPAVVAGVAYAPGAVNGLYALEGG